MSWLKIEGPRVRNRAPKKGSLRSANQEKEEEIMCGTRFFSRFERAATFLGTYTPLLTIKVSIFELKMVVRERS